MENQKPDARYNHLTLWNMSFAFLILGLGVGVAAWVFAIEFLYNRLNKRNQQSEPVTSVTVVANSKETKPMDKPAAVIVGTNVRQRQVLNNIGNRNVVYLKNQPLRNKGKAVIVETLAVVEPVKKGEIKRPSIMVGKNVVDSKNPQLKVKENKKVVFETLVVVDIESEPHAVVTAAAAVESKPIEELAQVKTDITIKKIENEKLLVKSSPVAAVEVVKEPQIEKTG